MTRVEVYAGEYEAFYRLIAVEGPVPNGFTTSWCMDEACRRDNGAGVEDWHETRPQYEDARLAGLEHCREVHVRGPWQ